MVNHTYFATRAAARLATFEYIEGGGAARAVQLPTETFSIELPHAQSTRILFLHFLNGRLKNLHYTIASPDRRAGQQRRDGFWGCY